MIVPQTGHSVKVGQRPYTPDAELAVRLLRKYFFNRTDRIAVCRPNNIPAPADPDGQLDAMLRAHVLGKAAPAVRVRWLTANGVGRTFTGRPRLGTYSPNTDGNTIYGCVDADGKGRHSAPLKDPLGVALEIRAQLARLKLESFLEKSGSGTGYHVWVLFERPVPAVKVRKLLFSVLPSDVELADGTKADAKSNKGLEVFPKQDRITEDGLGNMLWLPWWSGAAEASNIFYDVNGDGELAPFAPESFERRVAR